MKEDNTNMSYFIKKKSKKNDNLEFGSYSPHPIQTLYGDPYFWQKH